MISLSRLLDMSMEIDLSDKDGNEKGLSNLPAIDYRLELVEKENGELVWEEGD